MNLFIFINFNLQWDLDNNGELDQQEFLSLLKSVNQSSLSSKDVEQLGKF